MEEFVSDVEQVRLYAGASKATIVGHSMGAAIALQYAISGSVAHVCHVRLPGLLVAILMHVSRSPQAPLARMVLDFGFLLAN